jgi:hypothetical protein
MRGSNPLTRAPSISTIAIGVAGSAIESAPALWSAKTPCDFKISKIQEGCITKVT